MSARRHRLAIQLLDACGLDYVLSGRRADQTGWPTVATIDAIDGRCRIALHVAEVTSMSRKEYELRFQNPAQPDQRPMRMSRANVPLLIGVDHTSNGITCVGADTEKRSSSLKRWSVLFHTGTLAVGVQNGWAEYPSKDDERIIAFHPSQLPTYVAYRELGFSQPTTSISNALIACGFTSDSVSEVMERGRMAATRVIRDWRFSRDVVQAYHGRCAISGMNWRIVQAAHIHPVSAPGSVDAVSNGMALSPGYHALFDRHKIFIEPDSYRISFHPELFEGATVAERQFLNLAESELRLPSNETSKPSGEMLKKRYNYYGEAYSWAS